MTEFELRKQHGQMLRQLSRWEHLLKIGVRTLESGAPRQAALAYIKSVRKSLQTTRLHIEKHQ